MRMFDGFHRQKVLAGQGRQGLRLAERLERACTAGDGVAWEVDRTSDFTRVV